MLHSSFAACCIQAHYLLKAIWLFHFWSVVITQCGRVSAPNAGRGNFTEAWSTLSHCWLCPGPPFHKLNNVNKSKWIFASVSLIKNKMLAYMADYIVCQSTNRMFLIDAGHRIKCLYFKCCHILFNMFSLPTCQIWRLGQWPCASNYNPNSKTVL